jgi:alanyl-tRNA synthetase
MTAAEIRQSFLDFFKEKEHTIVPSSSLMPTSPNLLFTNAGMNQFVPYFLGTQKAPYDPPRAADTQKCIRAGGKHNDLEDVGYDTYHHTFFEMLGNWSFGNYFKKESIGWAWELLTERWGFPPGRLYATVYKPDQGDPADFDQEAYDHWKALFEAAGLDPNVHIVNGNKKDNFWMMGDTGPCGPCSELHIDLTPKGDTKGSLVNADDAACIEIWNLVFIQYNAEEDGSFRPLSACHVDTGMGFERAVSVMQCTNGFTDFSKLCSNYDTGVFSGIFAKLSEITGRTYNATVPLARSELTEQEQTDVAFRVVADHLRSGSFSIADGILPGNKGRNATIRAILRRAVRFGRELGLDGKELFLAKLVPVLVEEFGPVFPELREREAKLIEELNREEVLFNRTLDRGLKLFEEENIGLNEDELFSPERIVKLWHTYGFPIELTKVLLDERGRGTDWKEVQRLIDEHRTTGGSGGGTVIRAVSIETDAVSEFVGYDNDEADAELIEVVEDGDAIVAIVNKSPLYVEMGGQQGDVGWLTVESEEIEVLGSTSVGEALCLVLERKPATTSGPVKIQLEANRRRDIEKHHTATHLMHWALHELVSKDASQQGSFVGPERLRFDFNSDALSADQIAAIEASVNRCVAGQDSVTWTEQPYADVKHRSDVMQFFGDKYGESVRVVQIGGESGALDGYSMELCGGTHVRNTSEIGLFKIRSEGAIAAGIRRVEAVCATHAVGYLNEAIESIDTEAAELSAKLGEANAGLVKLGEAPVGTPQRDSGAREFVLSVGGSDAAAIGDVNIALAKEGAWRDALKNAALDAQKKLKKSKAAGMSRIADEKIAPLIESAATNGDGIPVIVTQIDDSEAALLQELFNSLKKQQFKGVAVLVIPDGGTVHLGVSVDNSRTDSFQAGKLIQKLGPLIGGKGGGKPEMARGAGNDPAGIPKLLEEAQSVLGLS